MKEADAPHIDGLLVEGNRSLLILKSLEPGLGIQLNTPYRFGKDVTAYSKAAEAFDAARTLLLKTLYPEQRRLDREGMSLLSKSKNVLKPEFGSTWNERWKAAGFLDGSIATPSTLAERIRLLHRLAIFLKASPEFEVDKMGVTAENAEGLFTALTSVRATLEKQEAAEGNLSLTMKSTRSALQKRLRGLRNELGQLLTDDDERWAAFGYVSPAERRDARRLRAKAKAEAAKLATTTTARSATPATTEKGSAVLSA